MHFKLYMLKSSKLHSGGSRIVRGGGEGFVLGQDIETHNTSTEMWCGERYPLPSPIGVAFGKAVLPPRKFLNKIFFLEYYILLHFHALLNNW